LAPGDAARVRRVAHTLKGAVANFGPSPALDFAFRLEIQGRDGNLNDATALLAQREDAVTRLIQALDEALAVRQ
jgi:HPt (histidine-containing phosphotransfer) domain-containing protein